MTCCSEGTFVSDRSSVEDLSSANAAGRLQGPPCSEELPPAEQRASTLALQAGETSPMQNMS